MLIDEVEIIIRGGHGGAGRVSFYSKKGGGPDGGNGGRGGDVYVQVSPDLYGLSRFLSKNICEAENGQEGGVHLRSGANGKNLTLTMPIGTVLIDQDGSRIELNKLGETTLLAKGGLGGRGNAFFKSASNTTPHYAQRGLFGQEKRLKVILKLIADFGLIGLPNGGKSSLLNEITNANAKIGDYPFTTLEPNLGVLSLRHSPSHCERSEESKIIADIPGLIEGAAQGKGLGHKFLKHIEKVKLLLHCISSESENPLKDYQIVREELKKFNPELLEKPEVILLTKSDLVDKVDLEEKIKSFKKIKEETFAVSIHDFDSLQNLLKVLNILIN